MKALDISPHLITDCLKMPGTVINLNKVLNLHVAFPTIHLYITIFQVTEDMLKK